MTEATVKMTGMEGIERKFQALKDQKAVKKMARKSARKAMKVVADAAKQNAMAIDDDETASMIYKNIVVQGGKIRNKNAVKIRVGVKGGGEFWRMNQHVFRKSKITGKTVVLPNPHYTAIPNDTRHWWLVEIGTKKTPAQPFMRLAFFNNLQKVTDIFCSEFNKELDTELSKAK